MENRRYWAFRLSLGNGGEPVNVCPVDVNQQDIMKYRTKVPPVDDEIDDIPCLEMDDLLNELKNGRLRQGWGMDFEEMSLDLGQKQKTWVENYIKLGWRLWGEKIDCEDAMGRYNILKKMTSIKIGDIIFVPRIPDESKFTIATVKKEYDFQQFNGFIGFGHLIQVEKIKNFDYGNRIQPKIFNPYRRAVGEIKEGHINFRKIKKFTDKYYV